MKIYALEIEYIFESYKNFWYFTNSIEEIIQIERHIQRTEPNARIKKHVYNAEEIEECY
jgi:hypothetical protein